MSNLKCPFCQKEMSKSENNMFYCGTANCSLRHIEMPQKALEEFAESYQDRLNDCKRIGNLNEELIRTHKALEIAVRRLEQMTWGCDSTDAEHLLKEIKEITALEQKDVK